MAWGYCDNCGGDLEMPTLQDDIEENKLCPICGFQQEQFYSDQEWLVMLWEELQEVKEQLNKVN